MAEHESRQCSFDNHEDWCFVDSNIHLLENLEISDMEIESDELIKTENITLNPVESCSAELENDCLLPQEDSCSEVFCESKLNEDVSDPGLYDQFLPDIEISSIKSYKHNRNKQLNFYLDLLLLLTVATALGLGTGYFIGWSDRCLEQKEILPMCLNKKLYDVGFKHKAVLETIKPFSTHFFENVENENVIKQIRTVESKCDILQLTSNKKDELGYVMGVNSNSYDSQALSSIDNSVTLNALKQQNEVIVKLYKNFLTRFHFKSSNQSVKIGKEKENKKHEPLHNIFFKHENNSLYNNTNLIAENEFSFNNITKLIQKIHTDIIGDKYNENNQQLKKDLSVVIKTIQELVHLADVRDSNTATDNSLKVVDDVFEEFKLHIDQKVTDLENFKHMSVSDILLKKKNKINRKMAASLLTSIDKLLQTSMKFINGGTHNKSHVRSQKIVSNSLKIIKNLEKQWKRNKIIVIESKEFEEQNVKKPNFKISKKESGFKNQNTGEYDLKNAKRGKEFHGEKQKTKKSHLKNTKKSHFKNPKESDFENKKKLKNKEKNKKSHFKNPKDFENTKKWNTEESHFKNKKQNAEESHFKKSKESDFENTKKSHFKSKRQNTEESHFKNKKQNAEKSYFKNKGQNTEKFRLKNKQNYMESNFKNHEMESVENKQFSNKEPNFKKRNTKGFHSKSNIIKEH